MGHEPLLGGIELGGTKTVLAVGTGRGEIVARCIVPTGGPEALIAEAAAFFSATGHTISALGVGAFGPVTIDRMAADFGRLGETNKPGWSRFDLVGSLRKATGLPIALVTDVGAAAIGEAHLGALRGQDIGLYITVGTGIGGAIVVGGKVLPALLHPEMGHITLTRLPGDDLPSACRFHENCAEGLAAGPAITARFGAPLDQFAPDCPEFLMIADYLGQLCCQLVLTVSPKRIILGGGAGSAPGIIPAVHGAMVRHLGLYGPAAASCEGYVAAPALGPGAGIAGALLCARRTLEEVV